jgi:hypothetical protein
MALIDPGSGNLDIERGIKTPVELGEKRVVSRETEYISPLLQAVSLGIGLALTVGAFLWLLAALGWRAFYIGALVPGSAILLWVLYCEWAFEGGITPLKILAAFMVAAFSGFLAFCLWGIVSYLAPDAHFARWQATVSLLVFVGVGATTLFLNFAFIQELLQRSPFQEQAIWGALFTWWKKPEDVPPTAPREVIHKAQMEIKRNDGRSFETITFPVSPEKMQQVGERLLAGTPFSERNMAGRGRPLSGRKEFEQLRDCQIEKGQAQWVDEDAHEQGVAITDDGRRVFEEYASGNGNRPTPLE